MRNLCVFALGCLAALSMKPAHAGVLIPVPPILGSLFTIATDINDDNIVTGYFVDGSEEGKAHAFYESLDGSSQTIFDDSSGLALPTGIDDAGTIVGETLITDQDLCNVIPFERSLDGSIVHIKKGRKPLAGLAAGLNNKGKFVGYYCDKDGGVSSYYGNRGKYKSPLTITGSPQLTFANGINKSGVVAGYFANSRSPSTGFILHNNITDLVQYPGANSTQLTAISDHGLALGTETDSQSNTRAFIFDTNNQTIRDIPVFSGVQSAGMNNEGLLIVNVLNSFESFVYCPESKKKCPGNRIEIVPGQTRAPPTLNAATLRRSVPGYLWPAFLLSPSHSRSLR
jgi:hypothetical protein